MGSEMCIRDSPLVYVATSVAKWPTTVSGDRSPICENSNVRIKDERRSAQNLKGLRSIHTFLITSEITKHLNIKYISTTGRQNILVKIPLAKLFQNDLIN